MKNLRHVIYGWSLRAMVPGVLKEACAAIHMYLAAMTMLVGGVNTYTSNLRSGADDMPRSDSSHSFAF